MHRHKLYYLWTFWLLFTITLRCLRTTVFTLPLFFNTLQTAPKWAPADTILYLNFSKCFFSKSFFNRSVRTCECVLMQAFSLPGFWIYFCSKCIQILSFSVFLLSFCLKKNWVFRRKIEFHSKIPFSFRKIIEFSEFEMFFMDPCHTPQYFMRPYHTYQHIAMLLWAFWLWV